MTILITLVDLTKLLSPHRPSIFPLYLYSQLILTQLKSQHTEDKEEIKYSNEETESICEALSALSTKSFHNSDLSSQGGHRQVLCGLDKWVLFIFIPEVS